MNHNGNANKMVSDTPRTDEAMEYDCTTVDDVMDFARQLERELNGAQYRIKRLEAAGDAMFWAFMHPFDIANESILDKWNKAKEDKL